MLLKSILAFLLFFPLLIFSQENNTIDTLYIEAMNDKLSIKIDVDNDIETFTELILKFAPI